MSAEQKDNLYKILFIDVGLMGVQLGLRITDLVDPASIQKVNKGAIAEQWIGQHLLDLRPSSQAPRLYYWVREKAGSMAEVDYLFEEGARIFSVEVRAGPSTKAASLQVFLQEKKKSCVGVHFFYEPSPTGSKANYFGATALPGGAAFKVSLKTSEGNLVDIF